MNLKLNITRDVELASYVVEGKINNYLKVNFYRIIERGADFIIFKDDEYSDRKRSRSDYHTRIGEGKFIFYSNEKGTTLRLIYLTPILYPIFIMTLFSAFGVYMGSFTPAVFSFGFTLPVIVKIFYLKNNVFTNILEA